MKYIIRYSAIVLMAVCFTVYCVAQSVVAPLKINKALQQKIEGKTVLKQNILLANIIQSGINYFRSITAESIARKPVKMGDHVTMQQELFYTNTDWPGSDEAIIQVDKTLNNNVPSYEKYELRFIFYPESRIDSAKKMYRDLYESINGCIVIIAANKAISVNEPFVPLSAEGGNRYKGLIEFSQFKKDAGVNVTMNFSTELNLFYTITLSFSKVRFHNKD